MMDSDVFSNEIEGVDPVDQLYGLFAGENFLRDLEAEHRQEMARDERITAGLSLSDADEISDNPPDPRHPRSISPPDPNESEE